MAFTGNEIHTITLADASNLTKTHRDNNPLEVKGFYYSKSAIEEILNQPECVGIRIYFGEEASGDKKLVIVGVEANEDDIETGHIAEYGLPCPSNCGSNNPLNS